jgi:hypothetical protein
VAHTRRLIITSSGRAREIIDDGCCRPVIRLGFAVARPRGTSHVASATGIVTSVHTGKFWGTARRVPKVGDQLVLRLREGIIEDSLTNTLYCGARPKKPYLCGA